MRALQSIAGQTYTYIEVVLVNDGGCDLDIKELQDILGGILLSYIRLEKNTGRSHAGNIGIKNAQGEYVGFLDDDDMVSNDYVESLTKAMTETPADVITFDQHCTVNGEEFAVNFKVGNPHEPFVPGSGIPMIKRPPYHMCFWHSKIAKNIQFRQSSYGEDLDWISRMLPYVTSETHIDKMLHYYRYSDSTSESIQYARK